LPRTDIFASDSKEAVHLKTAFNGYCEWIAHGHPPAAWCFTSELFSVTGKTIFVRASKMGVELSQDQLAAAKALAVFERYQQFIAGTPDDRPDAVWLNTLKAMDELFFKESESGNHDISILTTLIDRELEG
jgi:hypothetical protein